MFFLEGSVSLHDKTPFTKDGNPNKFGFPSFVVCALLFSFLVRSSTKIFK